MSLIPVGFGATSAPAPTTYQIEKSLRFRASASAYLSRTPAGAGNRRTWTWSGWVKRGQLGASQVVFSARDVDNSRGTSFEYCSLGFLSTDAIFVQVAQSNVIVGERFSTAVFRDPSAHYHILLSFDTTNATATDRIRVFVNGVQLTSFSSTVNPALNLEAIISATEQHAVGTLFAATTGAATNALDGYLSEINFIDGQALTPTSFGEFNENNVWVPKAYAGTYGTNGFYLPFNDGSSLGNLTLDRSGNGNNWTANNISLTAGVTYDWMDDTPTNNFAVLNPLDVAPTDFNGRAQLFDGNLRAVGGNQFLRGWKIPASGKWYWEATALDAYTDITSYWGCVGVSGGGYAVATMLIVSNDGINGGIWNNNNRVQSLTTWATNDVIGVTYDAVTREVTFYRNGVQVGTPVTAVSTTPFVYVYQNGTADTSSLGLNFGQRPFAYTPPTGFLPLCTKNLPAPAIANPKEHFSTYLYTGNGGALQVGEVKKKLEPYTVERSLRFRSSASAYLSRTFGGTGDRRRWTFSAWVKLGSVSDAIFSNEARGSGGFGDTFTDIGFLGANGQFRFNQTDAGGTPIARLIPTRLFLDFSAHYHIVCIWDTANATAADRMQIWVNGVRETSFSTAINPALNLDSYINVGSWNHRIASNRFAGISFFDGYLSEINFIDGQALGPAEFGQTDGNGYWVPKAYTGTYGTNGFRLPFNNTTSLATLTADASGNGNDWTATNISLTAGATYDSMVDVPGNTYAVLDPLVVTANSGTLSAGNLTATITTTTPGAAKYWYGSVLPTSGRFYFEATYATSTDTSSYIGISDLASTTEYTYLIFAASLVSASIATEAGVQQSSLGFITQGSVIACAFDIGTGQVSFYVNNVQIGTTITNSVSGLVAPSVMTRRNNAGTISTVLDINFGQRPFAYTPPTGFLPLNENNIAEVTNDLESPDLVWIKNRSASQNHALFDRLRGVGNILASNTTGAEAADVNSLLQFNRNGFYIGSSAAVNTASNNYVAWAWKANGPGVTNTAGTITSTVSANTTAGFSVVTYTGTGANATVGHGLGGAPKMVIVKQRTKTGGSDQPWCVYHAGVGNTGALFLNTTGTPITSTVYWNNTTPTSTVFTLGTGDGVNNVSVNMTYVAYCFAEIPGFSRIGSYTGNGSADGPFVFTNFRPRFLLVKRTDTAGFSWYLWDAVRETFNQMNNSLYPNLPNAENLPTIHLDFLSNGFKLRTTSSDTNANGGTYIFIAFAEQPFSAPSNAR